MAKPIAMICTTEELPDYKAADGTRLFALNLSTALDGVSGDVDDNDKATLFPWRWSTLTDVKVLVADAAAPGLVVKVYPTAAAAAEDGLKTTLEGRLDPKRASWTATDPGNTSNAKAEVTTFTWQELLAHASVWPAPVPQRLGLSVYFTVKGLPADAGATLFGAPEFVLPGGTAVIIGNNPPTKVAGATHDDIGAPWEWDYAGVSVKAYQTPLAFNATAKPVPIWLDVMWDDAGEDWRKTLPQRIAGFVDVVQLTIDGLRELDKTQQLGKIDLEALRSSVISLIRDTADAGLRYGPDRASLLRLVVEHVTLQDPVTYANFPLADWLDKARKVLVTADAAITPATWHETLKAFFPVPKPRVLYPVIAANMAAILTVTQLIDLLDNLQSRLADESLLVQVIFAQWNSVLWAATAASGAPVSPTKLAEDVNARLQDLAGANALRPRMLLGNFGGKDTALATWRGITGGANKDVISANIVTALKLYLETRWQFAKKPGDDFTGRKPDLPKPDDAGGVTTNFATMIVAQAVALAGDKNHSQALADQYTATAPVTKPHGLHLLVTEDADINRSGAGVVLFLRENVAGAAWTCLNAAALKLGDTVLNAVAMPPYPLMESAGVFQAAVTYDNLPVIAESPSSVLGTDIQQSATASPNLGSLFTYEPLEVSAKTVASDPEFWGRMPGLKFGNEYEAAACLVRNSGALPLELVADVRTPWVPRVSQGWAPPKKSAPILYRRRVRIGAVRYAGPDGTIVDFSAKSLPAIPSTVEPRAYNLAASGVNADTKSAPQAARPPVLLLWNNAAQTNSSYTFYLRPPATSQETWDRWYARDASGENPDPKVATGFNTRMAVMAGSSFHAPKGAAGEASDSQAELAGFTVSDISINDPAVAYLVFELVRVSAYAGKVPDPQFYKVPHPLEIAEATDKDDPLHEVQKGTISVSVSMGTLALPTPVGTSVSVVVPEGTVWKLKISAAILENDHGRFEDVLTASAFPAKPIAMDGTQVYVCTDVTEMLIETAAPVTISEEALWRALVVKRVTSCVSVRLDPYASDASLPWHLLRRCEVLRQEWRWMGRPMARKKLLATSGDKDLNVIDGKTGLAVPKPDLVAALNWEASAFAGREEDALLTQVNADFGPDTPQGSDHWKAPTLFQLDANGDLRAKFYRFTVNAYSRYQGLKGFQAFDTPKSRLAAEVPLHTGALLDGATRWKRTLVPCSIITASTLARPKVLIAIPLTKRGTTAAEATAAGVPTPVQPGLLVILDEPWYQIGGLAEELQMNVDSTSDGNGNTRLQIGPDPIFSAQGETRASLPPITGAPIGLTFDQASDAPLFRNTCFLFDLTSWVPTPGSLDWYMAKVNFQRTLTKELCGPSTPLSGSLSESTWVQFLPSSNHFTIKDGSTMWHVDDLQVSFAVDSLTVQPALRPGPVGAGQATENLELWALVMRDIQDATGHRSETYVGLYRLQLEKDTFTPYRAPGKNFVTTDTTLHVYLLEVQISPREKIDATRTWVNNLFPTDKLVEDGTHRVLRVSSSISVGQAAVHQERTVAPA